MGRLQFAVQVVGEPPGDADPASGDPGQATRRTWFLSYAPFSEGRETIPEVRVARPWPVMGAGKPTE